MKLEDILLNCAVVDDEELSRSMLTHLIKKMEGLNLMKTCESAIEAYNFLQVEEDIDLLFLDIEMPEMTGLELVKLLEKRKMHVILTTSQEHYALEAFEYDVTDYLIKPINQARLLKAITKVREKINNELGNQSQDLPYIFVRSNHKIIKLAPDEIQYIEALSDYIVIHTPKQKHIVHATMKSIEEKLATFKGFVRMHRSYIVNMLHVDVVHDLNVTIKDKQIPIGRSYRAKFLEGLDVL
jgi:DNA-binding LytR/AlgR family response regulator